MFMSPRVLWGYAIFIFEFLSVLFVPWTVINDYVAHLAVSTAEWAYDMLPSSSTTSKWNSWLPLKVDILIYLLFFILLFIFIFLQRWIRDTNHVSHSFLVAMQVWRHVRCWKNDVPRTFDNIQWMLSWLDY